MQEIDMKKFEEVFYDEYEFLYEHNENVAGYEEAVDAFDSDLSYPKFKSFVLAFNEFRNDLISSDREAAAFEFACEAMGLYDELLG